MPQLDILSYLTQIIWLTIIIGAFYLIIIRKVLPEIKKIFQVRDLMKFMEIEMISKELEESKLIVNTLTISNNNIKEKTQINNQSMLTNIKIKNKNYLVEANKNYLINLTKNLLTSK